MKSEEEIRLYISTSETNGALLLTGKWGSGKTYLMNEISKKINNEADSIVITISLFGLGNTEELNQKVKEALFQIRVDKDMDKSTKEKLSKLKRMTSKVSSTLSECSKIAKGINSILSVNIYDFIRIENKIECSYGNKSVEKNLVLVFDDFERSGLNITNLMGTINDYTENKKIKTIIIADEEKITKDTYKEFKEKLIFRTIRLKPNYSKIISEIISNYDETYEGYSEFLNKNYNLIKHFFNESELDNIRSLKKILIDFERVYMKWLEINIGMENILDVFYTFGATLFEHHAGNNIKPSQDYGNIFNNNQLKEKYTRFNENASQLLSLNNWIITGKWDDQEFKDEIKSKYNVLQLSDDRKFLSYNFWDLDNEIISKGLDLALSKAYKGSLSCDDLIALLQKIIAMKDFGIDIPSKPNYKKMLQGLKQRETLIKDGKLKEPPKNTFIMSENLKKMDEKAIILYQRIEKFEDCLIALENRLKFIDYMKNKKIFYYDLKEKIIASFDDELLNMFFETYKSLGNYEKRELGITLYNLHFTVQRYSDNDDMFISKENFIKLKSKLEIFMDNEIDQISKAITYELIKLLKEMISNIHIDINID